MNNIPCEIIMHKKYEMNMNFIEIWLLKKTPETRRRITFTLGGSYNELCANSCIIRMILYRITTWHPSSSQVLIHRTHYRDLTWSQQHNTHQHCHAKIPLHGRPIKSSRFPRQVALSCLEIHTAIIALDLIIIPAGTRRERNVVILMLDDTNIDRRPVTAVMFRPYFCCSFCFWVEVCS